jgi:hypothetical protein
MRFMGSDASPNTVRMQGSNYAIKFIRQLKLKGRDVNMPKFFASLCIGDGGGYVTIEADNYDQAREKMFASKYGKQWAFMYDESQYEEALARFNQVEKDYLP